MNALDQTLEALFATDSRVIPRDAVVHMDHLRVRSPTALNIDVDAVEILPGEMLRVQGDFVAYSAGTFGLWVTSSFACGIYFNGVNYGRNTADGIIGTHTHFFSAIAVPAAGVYPLRLYTRAWFFDGLADSGTSLNELMNHVTNSHLKHAWQFRNYLPIYGRRRK